MSIHNARDKGRHFANTTLTEVIAVSLKHFNKKEYYKIADADTNADATHIVVELLWRNGVWELWAYATCVRDNGIEVTRMGTCGLEVKTLFNARTSVSKRKDAFAYFDEHAREYAQTCFPEVHFA